MTGKGDRELSQPGVLYLSYDGMTDSLGQAQVVPYVTVLAARGFRFHVVSFEKPDRLIESGGSVARHFAEHQMQWTPLRYTKRPPVLSTLYDMYRLWTALRRLTRLERFQIVHCRSYIPAIVGSRLARRIGARFLFDMRGFWPEERVEAGLWPLRNPVFRAVYAFFKREERGLLGSADGIVVLTDAARRELVRRGIPAHGTQMVSVIPCSVDFSLFSGRRNGREETRRALGIGTGDLVPLYIGSLGTWYLLDEMLAFFRTLRGRAGEAAVFVIVTPDSESTVRERASALGIPRSAIRVVRASRADVPKYLAAADVGVSFIRATPSKISSSPTKIGEYLAMGLPVVTNRGIGDSDEILARTGGGMFVDAFGEAEYQRVADELLAARHDRGSLRENARQWYDLDRAVDAYTAVYESMLRGDGA